MLAEDSDSQVMGQTPGKRSVRPRWHILLFRAPRVARSNVMHEWIRSRDSPCMMRALSARLANEVGDMPS
jgi:hypothetical protein